MRSKYRGAKSKNITYSYSRQTAAGAASKSGPFALANHPKGAAAAAAAAAAAGWAAAASRMMASIQGDQFYTKKQNRARSRKNLLGAWGVEMVNVMVNVEKFGIVKVSSEGAMEGAS